MEGMVDADVCISSYLEEELACAADKQLWVINIINILTIYKTVIVLRLKEQRIKPF